jgi:phage gp45-like|tara:strand:+ start:295 stop:843 length:549 start_codon:yes stop_codon:yes gene_type:complete
MNLINKIRSLIKLAVVTDPLQDVNAIPIHQVSYNGKVGNSVPWFPFGFNAVPDANSLSLVVTPNGRSEERIDFPSSPQRRVFVETGEVVVYHPATQSKILFKSDGTINIESVTQVNVTAPLTQVTGNLDVTGTLGVGGASQFDGDATFDAAITDLNGIDHVTHEHVYHDDGSNFDTGPPKAG